VMHLNNIFGAVFPISSENIESLFSKKRRAFVKFTKFKRLQKGSKIIFYASKALIGEGVIEKVEEMEPKIAWSYYNEQISLSKKQYVKYTARSPINGEERKMRQITIFFLKKMKKYQPPITSNFSVTPAGRYISKEEYQQITKG
jgi:hypothetical protein